MICWLKNAALITVLDFAHITCYIELKLVESKALHNVARNVI